MTEAGPAPESMRATLLALQLALGEVLAAHRAGDAQRMEARYDEARGYAARLAAMANATKPTAKGAP